MAEGFGVGKAVDRLRRVLELLSLPGADALALVGRESPDALAIEFDEAYTDFVAQLDELPMPAQLESLQVIDDQLQAMSDPADRVLWTAESMQHDPAWALLRTMASSARQAFGWL